MNSMKLRPITRINAPTITKRGIKIGWAYQAPVLNTMTRDCERIQMALLKLPPPLKHERLTGLVCAVAALAVFFVYYLKG